MNITKAKKKHLDELVRLNSLLHLDIPNFDWDKKKSIAETLDRYYIALDNNKALGAISIYLNPRTAKIETIAIDPEMQGKGLGKRLVDFAKEYAQDLGIHKLKVESFCQYGVREFYEKCGFQMDKIKYYYKIPYYTFSTRI
jgi:N-acetylglutamate synthase-like GNAT family acetyltransferase